VLAIADAAVEYGLKVTEESVQDYRTEAPRRSRLTSRWAVKRLVGKQFVHLGD
jgi:hypothetical protein